MGYFKDVTPESAGISSKGILNFLDRIEENQIELHSFMVIRHGQCAAKGWWKPYDEKFHHPLYSFSKSLTATAIGFAELEGILSLDEKIVDIFPDLLPENPSENLKKITLHHLLIMGCGHETEIMDNSENWISTFLHHPVLHEPGTFYKYNTAGTNMLAAVLRKKTGQNVTEFLKSRLLEPLGITSLTCALAFSADYQNALLFREETTLRMMREMFEGYFKQSEPLFERLDTVQSQLGYTETLIRHFIASDSPRYFFQRMPCLSGLLTAEMLERHLVKEMPGREQMIRAVAQYAKVMQTQVLDKKTTMFFSEDGIKSFLETGRVDEYPKECYSPLDFDERIALIRRFLALRDRANLRMIRETKERAEHALNISVNANEGYLLFQTRTERLIYLSIREPSILMAFYDYLESMKPEELCTEEEMLGRVEAILHEFVACHSREGSI